MDDEMSYQFISSEEIVRKGKKRHIRIFKDGCGLYQEDNYDYKYFSEKQQEKYMQQMEDAGYIIRFMEITLGTGHTRIQWLK